MNTQNQWLFEAPPIVTTRSIQSPKQHPFAKLDRATAYRNAQKINQTIRALGINLSPQQLAALQQGKRVMLRETPLSEIGNALIQAETLHEMESSGTSPCKALNRCSGWCLNSWWVDQSRRYACGVFLFGSGFVSTCCNWG
jgi:hypothetical protein